MANLAASSALGQEPTFRRARELFEQEAWWKVRSWRMGEALVAFSRRLHQERCWLVCCAAPQ